MFYEDGIPMLFMTNENGSDKICKVGLVEERKTILLFPRQRHRGEERLQRDNPLFLEDFLYKAFLLREQLLAMSGYR